MVIKINPYFLHSEIPANTPNWLWYFHSGLSTDLLLRFSWPICPMPTMPMRAHMPTRVFRRFSGVHGSEFPPVCVGLPSLTTLPHPLPHSGSARGGSILHSFFRPDPLPSRELETNTSKFTAVALYFRI